MSASSLDVIGDLEARGLISQMTSGGELRGFLDKGRTLYSGFDPTAESLHIGNLVPLLALRRFQVAGHRPIALVGGATGLIGDPSFKASERQLNSNDLVATWVDKLKLQASRFLDFDCPDNPALVVNNLDWIGQINVLDFLRNVGKHFSVNSMIQKDSVKQRLDREGAGISFTEFSYMILQAYDFAELFARHQCVLQIGGSDQWGNITGGIDLTRRLHRAQVYGLTIPLVTKADGQKFGKTETGTVWLDANRTSPFAFYQFWLNAADADAYRFLNFFTFISPSIIAEIEVSDKSAHGRPEAQGLLAKEVTRIVHGNEGLAAAARISAALFSGDLSELGAGDFEQLKLDGLPSTALIGTSKDIVEVLVESGLAASNKMAREFIANNAVSINGQKVESDEFSLSANTALFGKYFVIRRGKKLFHLAYLSE